MRSSLRRKFDAKKHAGVSLNRGSRWDVDSKERTGAHERFISSQRDISWTHGFSLAATETVASTRDTTRPGGEIKWIYLLAAIIRRR